jgi:hypothetical protein
MRSSLMTTTVLLAYGEVMALAHYLHENPKNIFCSSVVRWTSASTNDTPSIVSYFPFFHTGSEEGAPSSNQVRLVETREGLAQHQEFGVLLPLLLQTDCKDDLTI